MPSKSRRRKEKRSFQSKKSKGGLVHPTIATQQAASVQTREPVSHPAVAAPAKVPVSVAKPTAIQYPYLATELRTIGILAGIMFIILIVLALVLR